MAPSGRPTGRRPGSGDTRAAIEAAAREQFAGQGYDRTTLRGVARQAGVDPALVAHFHGSKQRLFAAVMEPPAALIDALPGVFAGPVDQTGERLARFILGVLESSDGRARVVGLVRSAASEPEAAAIVRELVERDVLTAIAGQLSADRAKLRAALVGTQIVGLVMARYVVGVEPVASAEPETIVATLAPTLQRLLVEPILE